MESDSEENLGSPEGWFLLSEESLNSSNTSWPFLNITKDQFFDLHRMFSTRRPSTLKISRIIGSVISVTGIICTTLLIGTLWKKATIQKNMFFTLMLVISCLDMLFHLSFLYYTLLYKKFELEGSSNQVGMWISMCISQGLTYSVSLASDMCAVALTLERYMAIRFPRVHKHVLHKYPRLVRVITVIIIGIFSGIRTHYALEISITKRTSVSDASDTEEIYIYTSSDFLSTDFGNILATISDIVVPFSLSALMITLSALFLVAIVKRRQKRKAKSKSNTVVMVAISVAAAVADLQPQPQLQKSNENSRKKLEQNEPNPDDWSIVILTMCLDLLFLMNQVGYCAYWVFEAQLREEDVLYTSTYDEMVIWIEYDQRMEYASMVTDSVESLSHTLNFLAYIVLSDSIRKEFSDFVKRLVERVIN